MCSLGCLKVFIGISSVLVSLIGIAGIIVVSIGVNDLAMYTGSIHHYLYILKWSLIGFFIFVLVTGLLGIIGSWKKNACLLMIYDLTLVIFLICMFIIAIGGSAFLAYQNDLEDDANKVCAGDSFDNIPSSFSTLFKEQSDFTNAASTYFCSSSCPCNMSNNTLNTLINQSYPDNFVRNTSNNIVSLQQCPYINNEASYNQAVEPILSVSWFDYNTYVTSMNLLETELHCSGICTSTGYYIFSNVNNGAVGKIPSCKTKMFEFLQSKATYVCVIGWIIFFYIFVTLISSCCLCCKKRQEKGAKGGVGVKEKFNSYYDYRV